ncbi:potassium-transporting ATPase subunit KdpC [Duganella sp. BJB488]|uniref:potassium-transporting ATPase subunit KdpC n=1 Tax=unclassified Duganella TaxID=2636909 RepID=UPI000E34CC31|nr:MULTISPECIES: potassium-transporting ATPase subunit KdpC [unclassified Duganella]RFP26367.1 potassium-transporting ATPase subunit KdpC [Duganella sp. BJB489]RFP27892.1 potassium-transporting ATPase subunit KdpC [Duganella sp. BJB488]RFP37299.1 potassium-transporting ATPase subunit KdpC [Duganella sp. BJB480]
MTSQIRPALVLFGALTAICGVLYPLAVTGVGSAIFPAQAAGSLVEVNGKAIGSSLIGQSFSSPKYFWGRPSATGPMPNNAANSGGSNLGPLNPAQNDAVKGRIDALKAAEPQGRPNRLPIPVDLVTASASGVDPELSVAGAQYQVARIAAVRQLPPARVQALIDAQRQSQVLGFFGEPRVNVLALNLALDAESAHTR